MNISTAVPGDLIGLFEDSLWTAALLKVTLFMVLSWLLYAALHRGNPRWRVLLWRGAAIGTILIPAAMVCLPALEIRIKLPTSFAPSPESMTSVRQHNVSSSPSSGFSYSELDAGQTNRPSGPGPAYEAPQRSESSGVKAPGISHVLTPINTVTREQNKAVELSSHGPIKQLLPGLWIIGTIVMLLRLWFGARRIRRLVRHKTTAPDAVIETCQVVAQALGLSQRVDIRISNDGFTPFIIGICHPIILLPEQLCSPEQARDLPGIFAHELSHLQSKDLLWNLVMHGLQSLLWFHPLYWKMSSAHVAACEEVCDGVAAGFVGDSRKYSQTLARLVVNLMPTAPLPSGLPMARMSDISRRLNLLKHHVFATPLARRYVILSLLTGLCLIMMMGCVQLLRSPGGPGRIPLKEAVEILTTQAIHDAVIPTYNDAWHCSPALADLDGDGTLEIIIGTMVWRHDGHPLAGWPPPDGRGQSSTAVGDVDGDGKPEVAASGCLWRADGSPMPGWPASGRPNSFCTPCLDDVDGDGKLEILYTDLELGVCVRRYDGVMLPGWPVAVTQNDVRSTPQACDIDGDGKKEIIFIHPQTAEIRVHRLDGSLLRSIHLGTWSSNNFILADVNHDGRKELVYGNKAFNLGSGSVFEIQGSQGGVTPCLVRDKASGEMVSWGASLPQSALKIYPDVSTEAGDWSDSAVAADIDGDGAVEILFGNRSGGYHAYRPDGSQAAGWPKRLAPSGDCALAVGDLDGNGTMDVVAGTGGGKVYVFDCAGPSDGAAPWPLFMGDNSRDGNPDPDRPPRASQIKLKASDKTRTLRESLARGNWDEAIKIYQDALAVVQDKAKKLGPDQATALQQNGLLSIARVLNTRARRFDEAAPYYRQVAQLTPANWQSCQALSECSDLLELHPEQKPARQALDGMLAACLPSLGAVADSEANTFSFVAAKACLLVDRREEGLRLLNNLQANGAIAQNNGFIPGKRKGPKRQAEPVTPQTNKPGGALPKTPEYLTRMANQLEQYEGLPFLLTFQEERSMHVESRARDLVPGESREARTDFLLEIDPHSPISEPLPIRLNLSVAPSLKLPLGAGWIMGQDGTCDKEIEQEMPSGDLGTLRCNRILLFTRNEAPDVLTVRRKIVQIDATHEKVKIFYKTSLPRVEYGFEMKNEQGKIDLPSVHPGSGSMYLNEREVRFATFDRPPGTESGDLAQGVTIEGVIELKPGQKPFYPYVLVRAWGGGDEIPTQPRTATQEIHGNFEGVNYQLSSTRQFKLRSAKTDIFWAFTLDELPVDSNQAAVIGSPNPVTTDTTLNNASGPNTTPQPVPSGAENTTGLFPNVKIRYSSETRHQLDEYAYQEQKWEGATHVLGTIHGEITWTRDKSPYVVDENIWVARDGLLRVEPGAVVKFVLLNRRNLHRNDPVGVYICGRLHAEGTPDQMISFGPASKVMEASDPRTNQWAGIVLRRDAPPGIVKWCRIESGMWGIEGSGAHLIAHNIFSGNEYGIWLNGDFHGLITHNIFMRQNFGGVMCHTVGPEAFITNNIFYENRCGIEGLGDAAPYADYNLFSGAFPGGGINWRTKMEPGLHDISIDPAFVDAANGDYKLQQNSPARQAGEQSSNIGLDVEHWNIKVATQENERWLAEGGRQTWAEGLAVEQEKPQTARDKFEAALARSLTPEFKNMVTCDLGRVLIAQGRSEDAKKLLGGVIKQSRNPHLRDMARRQMAEALAQSGQPDAAAALLKHLEWPQSKVWVESARARCMLRTGNPDAVLAGLEQTRQQDFDRYLQTVFHLIDDSLQVGQWNTALKLCDALDSCQDAQQVLRERLETARALFTHDRLEEAQRLLRKSVEAMPYAEEAPEMLALLADVENKYQQSGVLAAKTRAELCTNYFLNNSFVLNARGWIASTNLPFTMPAPNKMILLDTSLGEAPPWDRLPQGGSRLSMELVARDLAGHGLHLHFNYGSPQERALSSDVLDQYGLVMMNIGPFIETAPIPDELIDRLVDYVGRGGNLLVIADQHIGAHQDVPRKNQILARFGLQFKEDSAFKDGTLNRFELTDHPAVKGLTGCWAAGGMPVTGQGEILGTFQGKPTIMLASHGKGKVVAAGLGGSYCDQIYSKNQTEWRMNMEFMERITAWLLQDTPTTLAKSVTPPRDELPQGARQTLAEYLRCISEGDGKALKDIFCFENERDRELFQRCTPASPDKEFLQKTFLFPHGEPLDARKAADDCWMVALGDDSLVELWLVDGRWKVLCPIKGRSFYASAKLSTAETNGYLAKEETAEVNHETDAQLKRRRARYLAALDLSRRHAVTNIFRYFAGIPDVEPAALEMMALPDFRQAVTQKLNAPSGLLYAVKSQASYVAAEPVRVTFTIRNVTRARVHLRYRPAVEIINFNNAITARGAVVIPRGWAGKKDNANPYHHDLIFPFAEQDIRIEPGQEWSLEVNLADYFDLPPARYSISCWFDTRPSSVRLPDDWSGYAFSDTVVFEVKGGNEKR